MLAIVKDELTAVRDEFATPRSTEIVEAELEVEDEDLIEREEVAVTVTHAGYIKRTPLADYRVQGRGGKGRIGMATREEDFVTHIFAAHTHAPLLFFSSTGMVYKLKVWRLPEAQIARPRQGDGEPVAAVGRRAHHHHPAAARRRERSGRSCRWCSPPTRATSAATSFPISPTSTAPARSR